MFCLRARVKTVQKLLNVGDLSGCIRCVTAVQCVLNPCVLCLSCVFSRITSAQQHGHDNWNSVRRPLSARHDRRGGLRCHEGDAQPPRLRRVSASQPHNRNGHIRILEVKPVRSELHAAEGTE